jgi:hypothetical protein
MATYKQIQERVRSQTNRVAKTCWIAHVMADEGLAMRAAPNRISAAERQYPCPPDKRPAILEALRHFGMLRSN